MKVEYRRARLETLTPPLSALYAGWKIDEVHAFLHLVPPDTRAGVKQ